MKKVPIWTWFMPIAAVLLVLGYYTGAFTRSIGYNEPDRSNHDGKVQVECKVYPVGEGWGYNIAVVGEKRNIIHQERIPVINGRRPFHSKEDAEKVGHLMIDKLKKGTFPPMITLDELKSMGIDLN